MLNQITPQDAWELLHLWRVSTKILAEVSQDVTMRHFTGQHGPDGPIMESVPVPAGSTVRIVMASRFGDVGITERLDAARGYGLRVMPDSGLLVNCRYEAENEDA